MEILAKGVVKIKKSLKIKESRDDSIFLAFIYTVLTIVLVITLFPLINVVVSSFSSSNAVITGRVYILPVEPTLNGYSVIFESNKLMRSFLNSVFYTVCATTLQIALTTMMAYPLARKRLAGRGFITAILALTMFFSGGLIPTYMVVKTLGLTNTRLAMIIPGGMSVYNVIVARAFFQSSLSEELFDAAEIDGYSEFGIFIRIVLPLSTAVIAVMALIYGVGNWNAYFDALIYLTSDDLFPLQIVLRSILIQNTNPGKIITDVKRLMAQQEMATLLKYSLVVVSSVPVLIFYPFIQKYFIKGVMLGSLKG